MLLDAQTLFSNTPAAGGDAPTSTGATDSTNVIDLGVARDIGDAVTEGLYLLCEVVTAFASSGSATLAVEVQTSADNSSWSVLYQSAAVPVASLVQGYRFLLGAPLSQSGAPGRYLKITYVIGTAAMTAGALVAGLVPALQHTPTYPRAYAA